ncbi:MAG: hypothetical protein AAGM67_13525, partial [Bacteroidota bacterium]
ARRSGIERVTMRQNVMRCYFLSDPQSDFFQSQVFSKVIEYVQTYSAKVTMKETPKHLSLIFRDVSNIKDVLSHITDLHEFVTREENAEPSEPVT